MKFELIVSTSTNDFPRKPIRGSIRTYKTFRAAKQALAWAESQFHFSKEYYELYLDRSFWEKWKAPVIKAVPALAHVGCYTNKLNWTRHGNR